MTLFSFRKLSYTKSAAAARRKDEVKESEAGSCLRNKSSSVNREYMEAFRTKSYVEVQTQLLAANTTCGAAAAEEHRLHTTPSHRRLQLCHLLAGADDDQLQYYYSSQPHDHHPLLNEYFLVSLEASKMCESLLKNVLHTRTNYDKNIKCATKGVAGGRGVWSAEQLQRAYAQLQSFSALRNPLSTASQVRFNEVQDGHFALLHRLTSRARKLKRKMKLLRLLRKALGATLAVGCAALALAFTLVAVHCAALCVLASPGVVSLLLGGVRKQQQKGKKQPRRLQRRERVYLQLDAAAKGVYVLINDFGTMSRLVGRVHDETEHNRAMAGLCARKQNDEMVKEVVRGLAAHEAGFSDHLKELEQHIYLCFLNIIRSRRMVLQQIINSAL
ncbi:unnamed protein product [Cuscuta epithymum]|uniref:Uncharacterized protein n=1 Tax=Cuscuta epithymum TaxID=186058 RepID=A0AAV0DB28_9ASTE|nr:unnamed protein product [Cuscuta epithymum]